jgi:hypothetical protein
VFHDEPGKLVEQLLSDIAAVAEDEGGERRL